MGEAKRWVIEAYSGAGNWDVMTVTPYTDKAMARRHAREMPGRTRVRRLIGLSGTELMEEARQTILREATPDDRRELEQLARRIDRTLAGGTHYHVWEYASGGSPRRTIAIFDERSDADRHADEHVADFDEPYVAQGDASTGYTITTTVSNMTADLGAIRIEECQLSGCTPDI
jgi:hypothetical protein